MSLVTPQTQDIADNIVAQIGASISQAIPILPKAFVRVLAKVLAAVVVILYKYCGFIFLQLFVAYASDRPTTVNGKVITPLTEWGRLLGVGDPDPATQAQLSVNLTVTSQIGSLPANAPLLFSSSGVIYQTVAEVQLSAPTVTVTIRATSDQSGGDGSGAIGNLQPGDIVEFANPLPNVASKATVVDQVVTGADAETTAAYRARIIQRAQAEPQGGAYADYEDWALTVPGIINAYPYAGSPGEIDIYIEADVVSSGSLDGIPTSAQIAAVLAAINAKRPINAAPNVLPITRVAFDVTIAGLDPDVSSTHISIGFGVDEALRARAPFIEGLSILPRQDRITQAAIGGVVESVVDSVGSTVNTVNVSPGPAYTLGPGQKAKLGALNFV